MLHNFKPVKNTSTDRVRASEAPLFAEELLTAPAEATTFL